MTVSESAGSEIVWTSHQPNGDIWFSGKFDLMDFKATKTTDEDVAQKLSQIFKAACRLNSEFLSKWKKYKVQTYLDFDKDWGLGSSSTLISCIAQWAEVNPYILLFNTIGGSGYDVACAQADGPLIYQLGEEQLHIDFVEFAPKFSENLYLVYLGSKADSAAARKHYYDKKETLNGTKDHISEISESISSVGSLSGFEEHLREHESLVSSSLHLPTVQEARFGDYWGVIKSLGAWGGDFILVTSDRDEKTTKKYFHDKGLSTVYKFNDLILIQG